MQAYMRLIEDPTQYLNAGDYADFNLIPLLDGFEWAQGEPPEGSKPYVQLSPLEQLEAIITQGQIAMEEAPLPLDIQKEIYDLEVFISNYYRRGASALIVAGIESFIIPAERTDVTEGQRAQVEALKTKMLAVFNAQ